jgi:hypothetical protein
MGDLLERLSNHKPLAITLAVLSVAMFVGSLLAVPWVIARAPKDYFSADQKGGSAHPLRKALKNVVGLVLVFAGVAMLLLPGQGIVTLLVGLALLDIPGKHALLVKLAKRRKVMDALNYVRRRAHREPFDPPK